MRGTCFYLVVLGITWGCACGDTDLTGHADAHIDPVTEEDAFLDPEADEDATVDPISDPIEEPEPDGDAPAVVLVGPPVVLGEGIYPLVVWTGSGWTVFWTMSSHPMLEGVLSMLDETAAPTGPPVSLYSLHSYGSAFRWADGRYSIVKGETSGVTFRIYNEAGELVEGPTLIDDGNTSGADTSYLSTMPGWVVVYESIIEGPGEPGRYDINAALLDGDAGIVAGPSRIGTGLRAGPRVNVLDSGLVSVVWTEWAGLWLWSFTRPDLDSAPPPVNVYTTGLLHEVQVEADILDDDTYVIANVGSEVKVFIVDTHSGALVSEPAVIARPGFGSSSVNIAAAPGRGFLGACYQTEDTDPRTEDEGIDFVLISSEAVPLDSSLTIATDRSYIGPRSLAWSGSEFLAVYQQSTSRTSTVLAQRIQPLL
jgi:hypothetical protein